jgi:hypothetical protein
MLTKIYPSEDGQLAETCQGWVNYRLITLDGFINHYKLALSNGPNRAGVSCPLTWGRKQIQFPKRCVLLFLEYRTMDKVQKPSSPERHVPSSEPFKVYLVGI